MSLALCAVLQKLPAESAFGLGGLTNPRIYPTPFPIVTATTTARPSTKHISSLLVLQQSTTECACVPSETVLRLREHFIERLS